MNTEAFVEKLFATLGNWFASLPQPQDTNAATMEVEHD